MVKEADRKRAYRPRGPHKEGCQCAVCKGKQTVKPGPGLAERLIEEPVAVRVDSLPVKARFWLGGQEHLVKEAIEGMVVCCNLVTSDTVTISGATIVKPKK